MEKKALMPLFVPMFSQIWNTVEQGDIGCTRGGGRDAKGVFKDAGLLYASNVVKTDPRQSTVSLCVCNAGLNASVLQSVANGHSCLLLSPAVSRQCQKEALC